MIHMRRIGMALTVAAVLMCGSSLFTSAQTQRAVSPQRGMQVAARYHLRGRTQRFFRRSAPSNSPTRGQQQRIERPQPKTDGLFWWMSPREARQRSQPVA